MSFVGCVVSVALKPQTPTSLSFGGVYLQGVVGLVDPANQTITLSQAFIDGIPSNEHTITLNAGDIGDLQILKTAMETRSYAPLAPSALENDADNDAGTKDDSAPRARRESVSNKQVQIIRKESQSHDAVELKRLQSGLESLGYQKAPINEGSSASPAANRHKSPDEPFDSGYKHHRTRGNGRVTHSYSAGSISDSELPQNTSRPTRNGRRMYTPKKIDYYQGARRRDDESCFSCDVGAIIGEEFDFERSNQMFDKEAVMEEITAEQRGYGQRGGNGGGETSRSFHHNSSQPSHTLRHETAEAKYRHDENILGTPSPAIYRQIKLRVDAQEECRTDSGLVVPCISSKLQTKILTAASKHGFGEERQMEAAGRSACEMLLQLLGGSQRLAPQNSHQTPSVVVLCGGDVRVDAASQTPILFSPPAIGLAIARQLSNHRVKVTVCIPQKLVDLFLKHNLLGTELKLLKLTDAKLVHSVNDLPSTPTDVILSALDAFAATDAESAAPAASAATNASAEKWYKGVVQWANQNKAPILAVDPSGVASTYPPCDPLQAKWTLQFILPTTKSNKDAAVPFSATPTSNPQLYLCDLGIPRKVFREGGIQYQSPFGAKSFIALHRD